MGEEQASGFRCQVRGAGDRGLGQAQRQDASKRSVAGDTGGELPQPLMPAAEKLIGGQLCEVLEARSQHWPQNVGGQLVTIVCAARRLRHQAKIGRASCRERVSSVV